MANNDEGGTSSKDYLKRIAEGSGNVDESGNFSIEVLRSALMTRFDLELPNIRQKGVGDKIEITNIGGFICNRASHWFAIRKINDTFYNLNSTLEQPEVISHFKLAAEMEALQTGGYSVFCVVDSLPPSCCSEAMMGNGLPQYWFKEEDLANGKSNATTRADDPWKDVGGGRRLDGKRKLVSDMSEDELLQMALAASLEQPEPSDSHNSAYDLTEEPTEGAPSSVKIQFRLPDGTRTVRRFSESAPVGMIYAFVFSKCSRQSIELRAGFPPKDLCSKKESTIADSKLAGEMIHGRYV